MLWLTKITLKEITNVMMWIWEKYEGHLVEFGVRVDAPLCTLLSNLVMKAIIRSSELERRETVY